VLYCKKCKENENIEKKGGIYRSEKVLRTMYDIACTEQILTQRRRRRCNVCGYRWTTFEINQDEFIKLNDSLR